MESNWREGLENKPSVLGPTPSARQAYYQAEAAEAWGGDYRTNGVEGGLPRVDVAPKHYTYCGIEPDTYMRANLETAELRGAYRYNVNKYLARYQHKHGVEDLRKARAYLDWLIELEAGNGV